MKKVLLTVSFCFASFAITVSAQTEIEKKELKETQEIIIRKKGDKEKKIIVEINGDNVIINGKPLIEFKDDEVSINKRKIIIRDGKGNQRFMTSPVDMSDFNFWSEDNSKPIAFLGVTTDETKGGALVKEVSKESAAEKAGLKAGDIITKVGDKKVDNPGTLSKAVTSYKPNEEVKVYYTRDGKEKSMKVKLGERKESKVMEYALKGPKGDIKTFTIPGKPMKPRVEMWNDKNNNEFTLENFEFFGDGFPRQQKLGLKIQDTEEGNAVKVLLVDKDSPAEKAGLLKDDLVTEIAGKKVANTDDMRSQLHDNMEKSAYTIKALRAGKEMSFDIKIPKKLKTANL